jgi:hypothetical protein
MPGVGGRLPGGVVKKLAPRAGADARRKLYDAEAGATRNGLIPSREGRARRADGEGEGPSSSCLTLT